jgi:anthranilate synthase/aminodeoxychorismate synthase-like glutamine amidotransferase
MPKPILVIDHYDSFTYNLVQLLGGLGRRCHVVTSGDIGQRPFGADQFSALLLSPGPGTPEQAVGSRLAFHTCAGRIPILGVCLGHQLIAERFGARVVRAATPVHGKTSAILHDGARLFSKLPQGFAGARYNSLVVDRSTLPPEVLVSAWSAAGEVMAVRHRELPIEGIQFHPESILSECGEALMRNWSEEL